MIYNLKSDSIELEIRASNAGKFRFKTRANKFSFGESFATRSKIFDEKIYLEWQIGYDAVVKDVNKGKKTTNLKDKSFVGRNGKIKYPYELSELLFQAVVLGLIKPKTLIDLNSRISEFKQFLSNNSIKAVSKNELILNGVLFKESAIELPTFFMVDTADGSQIEISIQKQQYAAGVQPMVYFCIPIKVFANGLKFIGEKSRVGDKLIYVINKNNANVLIQLVEIFGMCSPAHNYDIKEILNTLLYLINKNKKDARNNIKTSK